MKPGRRIAMDLTVAQEHHMRRAAGTARFAWNSALAEHRAMSDAALADNPPSYGRGRPRPRRPVGRLSAPCRASPRYDTGPSCREDAFAKALHVPVETIRDREQGRSRPDPAVRALLAIVADDPARAFEAIGRRMKSISDHADEPYSEGIIRETRGFRAVHDAARAVGDAAPRDLDAALKQM